MGACKTDRGGPALATTSQCGLTMTDSPLARTRKLRGSAVSRAPDLGFHRLEARLLLDLNLIRWLAIQAYLVNDLAVLVFDQTEICLSETEGAGL
jgi:hypothetical protein